MKKTRHKLVAQSVLSLIRQNKGNNALIGGDASTTREDAVEVAECMRQEGLIAVLGDINGRTVILASIDHEAQDAWFRTADEAKRFRIAQKN